jgi:myo-inositol-1(or 4)-monophosphatase
MREKTNDILLAAKNAAIVGGDIVEKYFHKGTEIRSKESYNLVSDADIESEREVVDYLRSCFPEHSFLGEESQKDSTDAEHLWIIDPLDGTNNFAHGVPQFSCSISYYHNGKAKVGVVYNPIRKETFVAELGSGAFLNGNKVTVSTAKTLAESLIGAGFYYDRGEMMRATLRALEELFTKDIHGIRRFGASSLDLCFVGCGLLDAYFEYKLEPWDFGAGRLFVEEAGGKVSTPDGGELPLQASPVVASNGLVHSQICEIANKYYLPHLGE